MQAQSVPFGTAVRVEWVDSQNLIGWKYEGTEYPIAKVVTVGFIVTSDKDSIVVSTSIANGSVVVSPTIIPWGAVQDLVYIGEDWNEEEG